MRLFPTEMYMGILLARASSVDPLGLAVLPNYLHALATRLAQSQSIDSVYAQTLVA
jgi:hypothetical protein